MSIDPNSPEARKGRIGEKIVKEILEDWWGFTVQKPNGVSEDTPTHIDWVATGYETRCIEVKTYKKFPYSFHQIPTFKIPLTWYESYKKEAARLGGKLELWFVNSEDRLIYYAPSTTLDKTIQRDGFKFPVTVNFDEGNVHICFHVDQFKTLDIVDEDDFAELQAIDAEIKANNMNEKDNNVDEKSQPSIIDDLVFKSPRCLKAPNSTLIDFYYTTKKQAFLNLTQLEKAGVILSLIPKSEYCKFKFYKDKGFFVREGSLFEILEKQDYEYCVESDLFVWWSTEGQPEIINMLDKLVHVHEEPPVEKKQLEFPPPLYTPDGTKIRLWRVETRGDS